MILVFGTVCIDRVRRIPRLPPTGGYVEIESEQVLLGGEAANTANALRRWGRPASLWGNRLGDGPSGQMLASLLEAHGFDADSFERGGGRTPETDVYVTPDGERTMYGIGFSGMESGSEPAGLPFDRHDWFTADPNLDAPARRAARLAVESGMRVYLMDFVREDDPIAPGSWWQSSTDWVGRRGAAEENREWLGAWIERHGCHAVLTDGPQRFWAGGPEMPVRSFATFPAPEVVDTTGAGDLFRAGMLFGLDQRWDAPRCLAFAAAAGSLACGGIGGTSLVPTVEEIERHIADHPEIERDYR